MMTLHICENELCDFHIPISDVEAARPYIDLIEDGERIQVVRYLYRSRSKGTHLMLCHVCHAAVQLIENPPR